MLAATWPQKCIYYWLLLLTALLPIDEQVTMLLLVPCFVLGLAVAFWRRRQPRKNVLPRALQVALYLLLLAAYYSLHNSADTAQSTYNFMYVVGSYCMYAWLLVRFGLGEGPAEPFAWHKPQFWPRPLQLIMVVMLVGCGEALYGIVQHFTGVIPTDPWVDAEVFPELKTRIVGTLVNPNIFAGYLVLLFSFALAFAHNVQERRLKCVFAVAALLYLAALLYTFSRGNWVAVAAVACGYGLLFARRWLWPMLACGAVGLFLARGVVWQRLASILSTEDTSVALRFAYLESTLFIIREHPWGVGWFGFQFVYPEYDFYLNNPAVIMYHCHNLLLNVTAELGVQGLICFVAVVGGFAYYACKLNKTAQAPWLKAIAQGYLAALIGIFVGGLTDYVYFNQKMGLLFWLLSMLVLLACAYNAFVLRAKNTFVDN